jgi:hypothetical protein
MTLAGKLAAAGIAVYSMVDVTLLSSSGAIRTLLRQAGIVLPYLDDAKEGLDYLRILRSGDRVEQLVEKGACAAFNEVVVPSFGSSEWAFRIRAHLPPEVNEWDEEFVDEKVDRAATALTLAQRNVRLAREYTLRCLM